MEKMVQDILVFRGEGQETEVFKFPNTLQGNHNVVELGKAAHKAGKQLRVFKDKEVSITDIETLLNRFYDEIANMEY